MDIVDLKKLMIAPKVNQLKLASIDCVNVAGDIESQDSVIVMPLVYHFSSSLKQLDICNQCCSMFLVHWTPNVLILKEIPDEFSELKVFLGTRGRLANVQSINIERCWDVDLSNFIALNARKVKKLSVDYNFMTNLNEDIVMSSVNRIFCDNAEFNSELLDEDTLSRFPNVF